MGWGQLLGAGAGFLIGGPAGMALGATLGGAAEEATGGGASGAARDAASAANAAADRELALRRQMYEEGVARQRPFYEAGVNALPGYLAGIQQGGELVRGFTPADYQADPGYAFRMSEGMKGLERSAAARGGLMSGATGKALTRYGQDVASQEYQNAYNRFRDTQQLRRNALAGVVGVRTYVCKRHDQFRPELRGWRWPCDLGPRRNDGQRASGRSTRQGVGLRSSRQRTW